MRQPRTTPSTTATWTATAWTAAAVAAAWVLVGGPAAAVDHDRDWSQVQLAWRDDPRPQADVPASGPATPRRQSRRAVRRAARRGQPLDGVPLNVDRAGGGSLEGIVPGPEGTATAVRSGRQPPISVQATLASPFAADPAVLAHRDQPYAGQDDDRRRFDIHLPTACLAGGLPLVVWIAGDDWQGGSRAECPLVWLVERGYAVASVDYRPSAAAVFPAQLDDCRAAIATLVREAETWGVDPSRICVVGRGAGGHLAALVALADPPADRALQVTAACAVAAPTHLASLGPAHDRAASAASRLVGGPLPELREAAQAASPLAHVSADDPPLLLVHGGRDAEVPADQAVRLDRAVQAAGGDSRLVLLDAAGHELPLGDGSEGGAAVLEFLDRVLGPGHREPPATSLLQAP